MTFPIERIRERFPALSLTDDGRQRVYLDNPAGTQVSQAVVDAIAHCLVHANANLGGCFPTSVAAGAVVDAAHKAMADFLGTDDPGEIIIGPNMTTLGFHLSRSLCRDFKPGDEIILTRMDHEGDVAPWLEIAEDKQLVVRWAEFSTDSWQVEPAAIDALLNTRTRLVALNYASNLLGSINAIKTLTAKAKAAGALVYVDAVQYAPHGLIDVADIGCDLLVCSSYKFFGPHLGIAWGRRELLQRLHAYKCRCVADELPIKFETGTPQIELLAGLTATVDYYAWLGAALGVEGSRRARIAAAFAAATRYEEALALRLITGLQALPGIEIFGVTDPARMATRVPTVSFRCAAAKPAVIAKALNDAGIFVWNGHNYALEVVRQLGIPESEGVVRVGIAHYNTATEVDRVVATVASLAGH